MNEDRPNVIIHINCGNDLWGQENQDALKDLVAQPRKTFSYDSIAYHDITDEDIIRYKAVIYIIPSAADDDVLEELMSILEDECVLDWTIYGLRASVSYVPKMTAAEALQTVHSYADRLGLGLDDSIVTPVAAVTRFGVHTTASCGGHLDRALAFPWIDIQTISIEQLTAMAATLPNWSFHTFVAGDHLPSNMRFCPTAAFNDVDHHAESFSGTDRKDISEEELLAWREELAEWAQDWLEV